MLFQVKDTGNQHIQYINEATGCALLHSEHLLSEYTSGWHLFTYLHPNLTIQRFLFLVEISFKNSTLLFNRYFFWITKLGKLIPN